MRKKKLLLYFLFATLACAEDTVIQLDQTVIKDNYEREFYVQPKEVKNTYTVTQEQIQEKNYKNVEEVLRDSPGVVVNNTAFGPKIDMRGNGEKSLSKVKVMVDGISINPTEESMASLPINSIPIESVKKIEVIPGGGVTLYGSGSVGGVVNIITNSNATKDNFFMDMKYASYDNRNFGFSGGNNITKNLYVNYGFNYVNSEGYSKGDDTQDTLYLGGFDYKINDRNKIRFQARHGKQKFDSTTDIAKELLAQDRRAPGLNQDTDAINDSYTFDYEHRFNDNLSFGVTAYRQIQDRHITADSYDDIVIILSNLKQDWQKVLQKYENIGSTLDAYFKEQKDGIKLKASYNSDKFDSILGYDYLKANNKRRSHTESQILKVYNDGHAIKVLEVGGPITNNVNIDLTKEVHSLYSFNKIKLTNDFDLTFGGRGEWTEFYGYRKNGPNKLPNITPKTDEIRTDEKMTNYAGEVGAMYRYNSTGNTYIRYERGFVTPFASQLTDKIHDKKLPNPDGAFDPPDVNVASIYVANGLKPEETNTIEFGVRDYIFNSFVALSLYATDTDGEITTIHSGVTNPAIKRWKYRNIGKTRRMGFELETEQIFDKLSLNQSVSYVDAKVIKGSQEYKIEKGDKIPMVPKAKLTFGGKYELTDNLAILASYNYVTEKETRELDENDNVYKYTIEAQGTVDAGLMYKIDDYSTLKLGVKNLTDKKYNLRETRDFAKPAPERNYYLELNVKF
ncbi:TonB-dependent receptor [Fusobacterium sp.]|uniref:TonB-dependent receptor n=2 Tax=Fusobacterium sp. TaxID=68766 RepID=UPI00260D8CD0|nr:TonB-dependent receptor [Fusobacterium sp.]